MELSDQEKVIQEDAIREIKARKKELIEKIIISKRPLHLGVISYFMAGSPGAGKTEFSRRYMPNGIERIGKKTLKILKESGIDIDSVESLFVRIDVDEIREFLSQYRKADIEKGVKGNSHVVQKAANKRLDIVREYCFKNDISFLHDGTFGNYETMRKLVKKSIDTHRDVQIFYIYLDPLEAWKTTKAREFLEGRNIVKEKFIDQFFDSRKNVDKIKQEFGNKVRLHCVLKNKDNEIADIIFDQESVDSYLKKQYNKGSLRDYSNSDLQSLISEL